MSDRRQDSHERLGCTLAFNIQGQWVKIPTHQYLRDLRLSMPSAGCWRGSVSLFESGGTVLENLARSVTGTTPIRFSFGALNDAGGLDAPVLLATVVRPSFQAAYDGFTVTYSFVGYAGSAWRADAPTTTQMDFTRGERCIAAFNKIAQYAKWDKWTADRLIVEPTDHVLSSAMYWPTSPRTSAIEMAHRLAQETQKNGKLYHLTVTPRNGGTVIFATREYAAKRAKSQMKSNGTAVHQYRYGGDAMGEVLDVQIDDNSLFSALYGSSNSVFQGTDEVSGNVRSVTTVDDAGLAVNAPSHNATTPTAQSVPALPAYDDAMAIQVVDAFGNEKSQQEAAKWYDRIQKATIQGNITVRGTHDLCPLDTIDLQFTSPNRGRPHFLSNTYTILNVEHVFDHGGWTTSAAFFTGVLPEERAQLKGVNNPSLATDDAGLRSG